MPLTPITRKEIYLATASGDYSGDLPEAITREERYLKKIAENGSGGGTVDAYTKAETDTLLASKADKTTTYTKSETDAHIAEKVAELVADAPEDFDTLKEMSDWIEHHEESASAMNSAIQANAVAISGKVDKVSGKVLSDNNYTTAEKNKLANLENYDDSTVKSRISRLVDAGAKNLLKNTAVSLTNNGVTFTVNADGSITANGTATANAFFDIGEFVYKAGAEIILSGCPSGGGSSTYRIYPAGKGDPWFDNGSGNVLPVVSSDEVLTYRCVVYAGYTADNLVFKPMLCTVSDYEISPEYAPYVPTNRELYEMILALQNKE